MTRHVGTIHDVRYVMMMKTIIILYSTQQSAVNVFFSSPLLLLVHLSFAVPAVHVGQLVEV